MADHLDGGTGLERLGATASEKARSYDANNNAGDRAVRVRRPCELPQQRQAESGDELRHAIGKQTTSATVGERRASELSESTTDGWHLLDADEERSSLSSSSSVSLTSGGGCAEGADKRGLENSLQRPRSGIGRKKIGTKDKSSNMRPASPSSKFVVIDDQSARERLNRTLVHLCTGLYSLLPLASLMAFVALISLLFTRLWFVTVLYYTYLLLDAKTCNRGGRRLDWVYRARFWTYLAAYFPIRLRYSRNFRLDSSENYILNYHPHGISAFGCVSAFATNGLGFAELFPGVRSRFMVHETSFLVPVMRETFGLRGDCSVNSASFDYILSKRWKRQQELKQDKADGAGSESLQQTDAPDDRGNLLALCGGGLAEADLSDMETLKIVCATRKGFVKKALIHGAHLVPCIAFGENSVFKKVNLKRGSTLHKLESKWYQLFKFRHPIYYGTSLLGSGLGRGVMPFKRPITVCMADPIRVERTEEPSQRQIDQLHSLYVERLMNLYQDNQDMCDEYDRKIELL